MQPQLQYGGNCEAARLLINRTVIRKAAHTYIVDMSTCAEPPERVLYVYQDLVALALMTDAWVHVFLAAGGTMAIPASLTAL
jgi:hypothetical protein